MSPNREVSRVRLLTGCLAVLALALTALLALSGLIGFVILIGGEGLSRLVALVAGPSLLAGGLLFLTIKRPIPQVSDAPAGWAAIIGGMAMLFATTILAIVLLGRLPGGSSGWITVLMGYVVLQGAFLLLVLVGIRAVGMFARPEEILRWTRAAARVVPPIAATAAHNDAQWLVMPDRKPRTRRIVAGAVAESLSGALVILIGLAFVRPMSFEEGGWVRWSGLLLLAAGIGLYFQMGLARIASVGLSVLTIFFGVLAVALGSESGFDWAYLLIAILVIDALVVLYSLGWLGRIVRWISFD